jgi:hypothetical protein
VWFLLLLAGDELVMGVHVQPVSRELLAGQHVVGVSLALFVDAVAQDKPDQVRLQPISSPRNS